MSFHPDSHLWSATTRCVEGHHCAWSWIGGPWPTRMPARACLRWLMCSIYLQPLRGFIVPPLSTVFHPIFGITVWEPCNESPSLARSCHITISLQKKKKKNMIGFSPSFPEVIPQVRIPKYFQRVCGFSNVSNNLANQSCNTRGLALVVTYKCNEKGGSFFKDQVRS